MCTRVEARNQCDISFSIAVCLETGSLPEQGAHSGSVDPGLGSHMLTATLGFGGAKDSNSCLQAFTLTLY